MNTKIFNDLRDKQSCISSIIQIGELTSSRFFKEFFGLVPRDHIAMAATDHSVIPAQAGMTNVTGYR